MEIKMVGSFFFNNHDDKKYWNIKYCDARDS